MGCSRVLPKASQHGTVPPCSSERPAAMIIKVIKIILNHKLKHKNVLFKTVGEGVSLGLSSGEFHRINVQTVQLVQAIDRAISLGREMVVGAM